MGQEQIVRSIRPLGDVLVDLAAGGHPSPIVMVDSNLVLPTAPAPLAWNEVRLKTSAGMVTLRRRGQEVALIVFGNATPELIVARERIAAALSSGAAADH